MRNDVIQIETTSRCTLKCPACSRTTLAKYSKKPMTHYDVDPDILFNFLDCQAGNKIKILDLCGDYGDSIYYPRLFELIEKFRSKVSFTIRTNGSYQTENFWKKLCSVLGKDDIIIFGIDGLKDTNHLYRVNSDWESIMMAVDIVAASDVKLVWETNVFSFNYNRLEEIKSFAETKGALFTASKTHRFGDKKLIPPQNYVDVESLFRSKYKTVENLTIDPDCVNLYRNTICAQHYFYPCGFIRFPEVYYKTKHYKNREHWSIIGKKLDDMIEINLQSWINDIHKDYSQCDDICKMRCKTNQPMKVTIQP